MRKIKRRDSVKGIIIIIIIIYKVCDYRSASGATDTDETVD